MAAAKNDPLHDDDDDKGSKANEALSTELQQALTDGQSDQDEQSVFEVGGDKKDEDDDEGAGGSEPRVGEHKRKKQERGRLRQELAEKDAEIERLRQEQIRDRELAAYNAGRAEAAPREQQADPETTRLSQIHDRVDEIFAFHDRNKNMSPELRAKLNQELRDLDIEKSEIAAARVLRRDQASSAGRTENQLIQAQNPDFVPGSKAWQYASALVTQAQLQGKPRSMDLINECIAQTRRDLRMPGAVEPRRAPPTERERERYTGMPKAAGSNGREAPATTIDMSDKRLKSMARTMYPNLPEKQAMQKWVNEVGPDYVKEINSRRRHADD